MATQTMEDLESEQRVWLQQASTKLYFEPAPSEVARVAGEIHGMEQQTAAGLLMSLKQGECLATGIFRVGNIDVTHPLMMSFRE